MALEIVVRPGDGGEFTVEVAEGTAVTEVTVVASDRFLAGLDVPDAPTVEVVREAVALLLGQRPDGTLAAEIDLDDIAAEDEDFVPELQSRLGF
ncbi:MAG: hypothetical protein JWN54_1025 [Mycobacterium sp.]|nr:hypothetical protein [Mycobacterium sp.]